MLFPCHVTTKCIRFLDLEPPRTHAVISNIYREPNTELKFKSTRGAGAQALSSSMLMIITGQASSTRQRLAVSTLGPPRHLELSTEISKTAAGVLRSPSPSQLSSYIYRVSSVSSSCRSLRPRVRCGHAGRAARDGTRADGRLSPVVGSGGRTVARLIVKAHKTAHKNNMQRPKNPQESVSPSCFSWQ